MVGPDKFAEMAQAADNAPVTDEEVSDAVVRLANGSFYSNLEIKFLAKRITD